MYMRQQVGLKELRQNVDAYITAVEKGNTFVIYRRSQPVFKISPAYDEVWEEVVDFTKLRKGGVNIEDLLNRL